ncbi:uncharacterized protein LOC124437654 [Xenia sp. Carnegie-2017]|uniref:uncharacterized protein LOC124437654 n=1 Tax=Xenia sp. Carnegie-2017 TaxID=2897299 RepID=UPI001F042C09|nr:uncharacterized protein LOC124437654 [Xenia sp. Carnegie-2017]XP_046843582.1 uncharacterized protein LOC124437654 [Xenia sp. Carnegie-2017]XP_046843583.1 uncharacterized protein LOC124437654 [Xenia sp. Carnegie-2017]
MPPPGQPGYGMPPPGQPGYGMPPPGQPGYGMPPPGQPGYGMPPPGYPGGYAYPSSSGYPHSHGDKTKTGNDSDDSQPGDSALRSKGQGKKIYCIFQNLTGKKVELYQIDAHGKVHRLIKLKDGKKERLEVYEGDVFVAGSTKKKMRLLINNNTVYTAMTEKEGENTVLAHISRGPDEVDDLSSDEHNNVEVKVKFVNRSKNTVQLVLIDHKGKWLNKKVVIPGKCYTTKSYGGHKWIAHDVQDEDEGLYLNYGFFYSPWKSKLAKERVIITHDRPFSESSSSGSSSSSD